MMPILHDMKCYPSRFAWKTSPPINYLAIPSFKQVVMDRLYRKVCEIAGEPDIKEFEGKKRRGGNREKAYGRHLYTYIAWRYKMASLTEIGKFLGGRSHSTVSVGKDNILDWLIYDRKVRNDVDVLVGFIEKALNGDKK